MKKTLLNWLLEALDFEQCYGSLNVSYLLGYTQFVTVATRYSRFSVILMWSDYSGQFKQCCITLTASIPILFLTWGIVSILNTRDWGFNILFDVDISTNVSRNDNTYTYDTHPHHNWQPLNASSLKWHQFPVHFFVCFLPKHAKDCGLGRLWQWSEQYP